MFVDTVIQFIQDSLINRKHIILFEIGIFCNIIILINLMQQKVLISLKKILLTLYFFNISGQKSCFKGHLL